MNTKTTLFLAMAFVVLVLGYMVLRSRPKPADPDAIPAPGVASATARDLLEEKLGEVVKVVCKPKDGKEWVFQKQTETSGTGQAVWRMTSPMEMKVVSWEVEKFGRQLGDLQYELSYRPGEPGGVTAAEAGLDPLQATVTMTDADGLSATVEIGNPASDRETYVRLAGSDEICVAKSNLRNLIKEKAVEYREKRLWTFKPEDVTRVEIVDRSATEPPISYAFVKDGARWMMESPVTARATSKVDDTVRAMSGLRAIAWQEDRAERLAMYGLDPPALSVSATVEEEIQAEKDTEDERAAEPYRDREGAAEAPDAQDEPTATAPEKKVTIYQLHLADRSPIGEKANTYMRIADEHAVATVSKTTADKFKPVMSQWREMHLTMANVAAATRIGLTTPEGSATLLNEGGAWLFDPDGGHAEASAVSDLLTAIGDLTAVTFIDEAEDPASFGLDEPQAEIRLTIPGVEGVERITVGGYTDENTRRLVYVRRNELASIGKVPTSDVAKLVQTPRAYRDRTVIDVPPSRFEKITLSTENRFVGGRSDVTFERNGGDWSMVEPVSSSVRADELDGLLASLGRLRAERVVAEGAELSDYSLHAPAVTVALTHELPVEDLTEEPGPQEPHDSPLRTLEISVAEHDGKYYAKRSDRPTIYEMTRDFYSQLVAEYRTDRVMDFDDTLVRQFSIRKADQTHVFERKDDRWTYQAEPDLPLDSKKVENLLSQLGNLLTPRYVCYGAEDLAVYGLTAPLHEVTVTLEDGTSHVLLVSDQMGDDGTDHGFYATVKACSGVFLLTADSVKGFETSLDELEERR